MCSSGPRAQDLSTWSRRPGVCEGGSQTGGGEAGGPGKGAKGQEDGRE